MLWGSVVNAISVRITNENSLGEWMAFSRSNDYTSTFGGTPDEGCLTPFIAESFPR